MPIHRLLVGQVLGPALGRVPAAPPLLTPLGAANGSLPREPEVKPVRTALDGWSPKTDPPGSHAVTMRTDTDDDPSARTSNHRSWARCSAPERTRSAPGLPPRAVRTASGPDSPSSPGHPSGNMSGAPSRAASAVRSSGCRCDSRSASTRFS